MDSVRDFLKTTGISFIVLLYSLYVVLVSPGVYELTLLFLLIALTVNVKKFFDRTALLLFFFSLSYAFIKFAHGELQSMFGAFTVTLGPPLLYAYGRHVAANFKRNSYTTVFWLCIAIAVASLLYRVVVLDIMNNGFINIMRQLPISMRSGDELEMAATLYGVNVSLGFTGLTFLIMRNKSQSIMVPILFLLLAVLSLVTVSHLVTRTGLVLAAAVLSVTSVYKSNKNIIRVVGIVAALIIAFLLLIQFNIISTDVIEAYSNRQSGDFDSDIGGDRLWRWMESIPRIIMYPFGWATLKITKYVYVHNLWLDLAMDVGIIPFSFLLAATIRTLRDSVSLFKIKNDTNVALLMSLAVVMFLTCMVEPIMNGARYYLYMYCIFMGYQKGYLQRVKYKQYVL